jgi:hypothetical protein
MNNEVGVNMPRMSRLALEKLLEAKLREILASVGWLQGWRVEKAGNVKGGGFDLLATFPLPQGGKAALCVECKKELRPSAFRIATDKIFAPSGQPAVIVPVLAMPFISPRIVDLCAEHGWSWFDLAGNYRLDVPGLFQLRQTGQEAVYKQPRPEANLSTAEAGRVIRAILAMENIGKRWTQRLMEEHFQLLQIPIRPPSLGLVNKVVRHLREEAFIEEDPNGGFKLRDPLKLLFSWRDAYRFDRHERRDYFTLLQGKQQQEALARMNSQSGGGAAYAAFSAADYQAPHVRQPKTWLFVSEREIAKFENSVDAKQVESGENLIVLIPDDEGVFYLGDGGAMDQRRMACTNLIQTYVDLSHCGGRGVEAAEALLEQRLKPEWKAKNML